MKTTGFDSAWQIPAGATVTEAYWAGAYGYGPGEAHATQAAAIAERLAYQESLVAKHNEHYGARAAQYPHPESFSVDLRWKMSWPADHANGRVTSGIEATVQRTTYDSLDDARQHLVRIAQFA